MLQGEDKPANEEEQPIIEEEQKRRKKATRVEFEMDLSGKFPMGIGANRVCEVQRELIQFRRKFLNSEKT